MRSWWLVFKREYLARIKKSWFWLTTFLMPVGFILIAFLPALIGYFSSQSETSVAIVDQSNTLQDIFPEQTNQFTFSFPDRSLEDLKANLKDADWKGLVVIPEDGIKNPDTIQYVSYSNLPLGKQAQLETQLTESIRTVRYNQAGLSQEEIKSLEPNVAIETLMLGQQQETSSIAAYVFGFGAGFFMYFLLLIYGQMLMKSVLEEKKNKLVDLVISSVSPLALMFGKITSIIAISITQIFIWIGIVSVVIQGGRVAPLPDQFSNEAISNILSEIGQVSLLPLVALFVVMFIGGYFLYASLSAMIAAGADEESDVQQVQSFIIFPLMIALFVMFSATQNPDGAIAFWGSIIPFSSPLVMLARFPFQTPLWEILLSIGLLYGLGILVVWLAARVYRVGILLYGQRPGPKKILKWMIRPQ